MADLQIGRSVHCAYSRTLEALAEAIKTIVATIGCIIAALVTIFIVIAVITAIIRPLTSILTRLTPGGLIFLILLLFSTVCCLSNSRTNGCTSSHTNQRTDITTTWATGYSTNGRTYD